jgi:hypothetical protein
MNLTRATYAERADKVRDFVIGYLGWFILNALLNGVLFGVSLIAPAIGSSAPDNFELYQTIQNVLVWVQLACNGLLLLLNVGLIIYFALTRYWIALGALSAFATLLALALCAAIFVAVACFAIIASSGSGP